MSALHSTSNTAYRERGSIFSNGDHLSSQRHGGREKERERQKSKRKGHDILFPRYPRVARSDLKSARPFAQNMSFAEASFLLSCSRRFFQPSSRAEHRVDNALPSHDDVRLYLLARAPTISRRCSSCNYPPNGRLSLPGDPGATTSRPGQTTLDSTLLGRRNDDDDVRRRREQQWYRRCCGQPRAGF